VTVSLTGAIELAAALALFAALCFGLQAIVVEIGMRRGTAFAAAFVSIVVSSVLFWVLAAIRGIPVAALRSPAVLPLVIAGVGYPALFRLLYFEGIERVGPSLASAIIAANPAVAALIAVVALGERTTPLLLAGLALIVVGAAALQFSQRSSDDRAATDLLMDRLQNAGARDLLYPAGAMLLYGSGSVLIKYGIDRFPSTVTATAVTQTSALVVFLGLLAASSDARSAVRIGDTATLGAFAVSGVFVALAWLGQFFALRAGTVVTVIPLINVYPLIVVVITYALARQIPRSPRILAGVLSIAAGATLLQL
jgi:drug/metabolite transporter (DMT)-like permease